MKRTFFIAVLLAVMLVLSGCSENNSEISGSTGFNSFILFSASGVSDAELDEIARVIESRATADENPLKYRITPEYDTDTVRLEFDYIADWAEHFVETATDKNVLEFHKGEEKDGELILTNKNIKRVDLYNEDYIYKKSFAVSLEFDVIGCAAFTDATEELTKNGERGFISIWLDDEKISCPRVTEKIPGDSVIITGNFDFREAEELAAKMRSAPLYYDVIMSEYNFGR